MRFAATAVAVGLLILSGHAMATTSTVSVDTPAGTLAGTLQPASTTQGKAPLALIIPGSGPTDRDGNNPMGVHAQSYRLLAEGLAAQGIASVRIDKRGMFGSAHPGLDANKVTLADYTADIHAWVKQLRKSNDASCVWLIGHSEGALVAVSAAAQGKDICGLVLVSGGGRPMADVIATQLKGQLAGTPMLAQALDAIESLRHGKPVDASTLPAPLQGLFNPAVQGYEMSVFPADPVALLRQSRVPTLVVQGTEDLQVTTDDARLLAGARAGTTLKLIDGMNHVLKKPAAGRQANLSSYADPDMPLDEELVPAIAGFIKQH